MDIRRWLPGMALLVLAGCSGPAPIAEKEPVSAPAKEAVGAVERIPEAVAAVVATCPKEVSGAVLDKVYPEIGGRFQTFLTGPMTVTKLDEIDRRIACVREWSASVKDRCQRDSYIDWLKFYAEMSKAERAQLANPGSAVTSEAKQEQEDRERKRRQADYEREHQVPKPPQCDVDLIRRVR